jgi:Mrp family chromosome partitioning ATPase/capsular polysaccharide biosynthesis protein
MDIDSTNTPHLADYARPLWSRKWLIVVAVIAATGAVYAYYNHQAKVYRASTLVFVKDPGDPVSGVPSLQSTDRSVSNQASLLYSRDIAAQVKDKIGYRGTASDLLKRVSLTSRTGEDFVNVSARGRSPREAADIANAYARQFVELVNNSQSSRVKRALELTRTQLKSVPKGPAAQATRAALNDQIHRLELVLDVPPDLTHQVDPAAAPSFPASPRPKRNALFAFVLSLLLATAAAFGLERFDRRLKRPEDFERAYGKALLAILPHTGDPAPLKHDGAALSPEFREAFRVLKTNIELARLDDPPRTIVISSAMPGEGKSTVTRNLALAFRETGKRVAVVEGDLRHPALAKLFGVHSGPGLTEILTDDVRLSEVTLPVATTLPGFDELSRLTEGAENGNGNGVGPTGERPGSVTLLLAGAKPANPPAVLASARVVEVIDALRESHDIVLIDSAPLLAVTDTVPLLRYADAAIFVGRLGVTTRDTAKRLSEFLARIPDAAVLGMVANDLSQFEATGYGYGYGYGYGDEPKRFRRMRRSAPPKQLA